LIERAVAVAEVAVANADVVGVDVFVFVAVGSVCLWQAPERQGRRERKSDVRELSCLGGGTGK